MPERRRLSTIMTKVHPQWDLFVMLLDAKLDYNEDEHGKSTWDCNCTLNGVETILQLMSMDIEKSIEYLQKHGGYCDCEVMFNVACED